MAHALPVQFTEFPSGPTGFLVNMGIRDNGDLWVGQSDGMPQVKHACRVYRLAHDAAGARAAVAQPPAAFC